MRTKLPISVLSWAAILAFSLGFTTPAAVTKNATARGNAARSMALMMSSCDPSDPAFTDFDSDGVGDDCDVDDDNDGVLDSDEGCETLLNNEFGGTFGTSPSAAAFYRDLQTAPGAGYTYSPNANGLGPAGRYAVLSQAGGVASHPGALWHYGGHTNGSDTDCYLAVNGSTTAASFFNEDINLTGSNGYRYSMWHKGASNPNSYELVIEIRRVSDDLLVATI